MNARWHTAFLVPHAPLESIGRVVGEQIGPLEAVPGRVGVVVATSDLGVASSAAFWEEARVHGPGFANPRWFPWCLASALGANVALARGFTGPCSTVMGGAAAAGAAVEDALLLLYGGVADVVLVLGVDEGEVGWGASSSGAGFLLTRHGRGGSVRAAPHVAPTEGPAGPGAVLASVVAALQRGEAASVASGSLRTRLGPPRGASSRLG